MPLPPEEVENGENSANEEPKLQFSYVECLLFGFHQLGKKLPDFLLDKVDAERLKDFKIRWESDPQKALRVRLVKWNVIMNKLCVFDGLTGLTGKLTVVISHGTECCLCFNRLQYFARGLQVYIRQLRVALQGKTGDALKTEEVTMTAVTLSLVGSWSGRLFCFFVGLFKLYFQ